jgi:hypothetical protein
MAGMTEEPEPKRKKYARPKFGTGGAISALLETFEGSVVVGNMRAPESESWSMGRLVVERDELGAIVPQWAKDVDMALHDLAVVHDPLPDNGVRQLTTALRRLGLKPQDYVRVMVPTVPAEAAPADRLQVKQALVASGARWVILFGAGAVKMWRTDVTIKQAHHRMHTWADRWNVWCMESPSAVSRAERNGTPFTHEWRASLLEFATAFEERKFAGDLLARSCICCDEGAVRYDRDLVACCERHLNEVAKGRAATRKHWHEEIEGQGAMEL